MDAFFCVSTRGGNGGGTGLFLIVVVDDLLYNKVEFEAMDDVVEVAEVLLLEYGLSFTDEYGDRLRCCPSLVDFAF